MKSSANELSENNSEMIMSAGIPLMTPRQFSILTGLEEAGPTVIHGMIQRKTLPTFKLGRYRMIDMEALRDLIAAQREQQ